MAATDHLENIFGPESRRVIQSLPGQRARRSPNFSSFSSQEKSEICVGTSEMKSDSCNTKFIDNHVKTASL
jgi:hypothetical protein